MQTKNLLQDIAESKAALTELAHHITTTEQEANDLIGDTIYLAKKYAAERKDEWSMKSWLCAIACNVQLYTIRRGRKVTTAARTAHACLA